MKLVLPLLFASWLVAAPNRELIICGWDEVYILDLNQQQPEKVWSWRASDSPEIPEAMRRQFRTTDECKPVEGGKRILITSSSDGVALVDRASRKAVFRASVPNAHSAELLPGGRIVVAASVGLKSLSNRLVLFNIGKSETPVFDTALFSGHGAVWDSGRQLLWALGMNTLYAYQVSGAKLIKEAEYKLPQTSGHDLMAVPGTDLLSLSTHSHAWVFDRQRKTFSPHPRLADAANVKSIDVHPETREIVWTEADRPAWWTATLRFQDKTIERTGERLYKARWMPSSGYDVRSATASKAMMLNGDAQTWNSANEISWGPEKYLTKFRALWNKDGLYLRFDSTDPQPWHTMTKRDQHLWDEEVVEIFLDLDGSGRNYAEVEVNPANVICDVRMVRPSPDKLSDLSWNHDGLESKVVNRAGGWIATVFLPWPGFRSLSPEAAKVALPPAPGSEWRFNLFRIERPGGPKAPGRDGVFAAWSPTGQPSFHVPAAFRPFRFVR